MVTVEVARRRAIVLLAAVSAVYVVGLILWLANNPALVAMDFKVYWQAAHETAVTAYAAGHANPFPYPPTMLLWVAPLAFIPLWPAYLAFVAAGVAAFVFVARRYLTGRQLVVALACPPIVNGLSVGQCSLALAAALLLACGMSNRMRAGIVFGLIASVKPQLVLMAPLLFLLRRDWWALLTAALTWSAMAFASVAVFGLVAWRAWIGSLSTFHAILMSADRLGMALSPAFVAGFLHLPPLPFLLAGFVAGLWLIWIARHSTALVQCAVIATASLLSAPYAMVYDLAAVIPFLVVEIWAGSIVAAFAASGAFAPLSLPLAAWRQQLTICRLRPVVTETPVNRRSSLLVHVAGEV